MSTNSVLIPLISGLCYYTVEIANRQLSAGLNPFDFRALLLLAKQSLVENGKRLNPFDFRALLLPSLKKSYKRSTSLNPFDFRALLLPCWAT